MKRKICFIFELLLKIATIIFAFWGVCLQARDDGGFIRSNTYLYFTIISNLETVIIFSVFVVLRIVENIKGKQIIPKPLFMLKFMITAAMTITLTVAALLLAPLKDNVYLFSMKNLSLHIIAPILAMMDFLMIDVFGLYITAFVFGNDVADFDKRGYIFKRNEFSVLFS